MTRVLLVLLVLLTPVTALAGPRFGVEVGGGTVWLSDALDYVGRTLNGGGTSTARPR